MSPLAESLLFQIFDEDLAEGDFLLSVSGGPDSVCLAHLFKEIEPALSGRIYIFHINFGLRARDAKKDAHFVEALANKLNWPFLLAEANFNSQSFSQQKGRNFRSQKSKPLFPKALLVEAHHLDDQTENFLFRLFRGAGPEGLVGMEVLSQREGRGIFRPFLKQRKAELIDYLTQQSQSYCVDRSNFETQYDRNWVRNSLIPEVEKKFPGFPERIEKTRSLLAVDEAFLTLQVERAEVFQGDELERRGFRELDPSLQLRGLRLWLKNQFEIHVGFDSLLELRALILSAEGGAWNGPRNAVFRCRGAEGNLVCSKRAF